jgi:hypothetical protein
MMLGKKKAAPYPTSIQDLAESDQVTTWTEVLLRHGKGLDEPVTWRDLLEILYDSGFSNAQQPLEAGILKRIKARSVDA